MENMKFAPEPFKIKMVEKIGNLTKEEFLDWYNDPNNYRPELPGNNRSHKYE